MNGADPPDRARPLGLSTLQGRNPSTCAVPSLLMRRILKKDDRRAAPKVGDNQAGDNHRWIMYEKQTSLGKCENDTCHWVGPERPGDDAARGAPPAE